MRKGEIYQAISNAQRKYHLATGMNGGWTEAADDYLKQWLMSPRRGNTSRLQPLLALCGAAPTLQPQLALPAPPPASSHDDSSSSTTDSDSGDDKESDGSATGGEEEHDSDEKSDGGAPGDKEDNDSDEKSGGGATIDEADDDSDGERR